jgi:cellulose synthase/poly-beta-1,6-N-acetylglucosamine synthase-like glycosyltransferase
VHVRDLLGDSWITMALFCAALAIVIADFVSTIFAIIYQRLWYTRRLRPRYQPGYTPSCAVIIPCKGLPRDFERNLRTFLGFDYPSYRVVFVTESENDPAAAVIRKVVGSSDRAMHVVAGLATACAQKNYNLLAAVRAAGEAEVYVFADGDIGPTPGWLRELVLPLSDPAVAVTTGFRWLRAERPSVGPLTHNYINIFIYVLFSVASFVGEVGLWGGSMAIRKRDFDALDIADLWGRSAVDDMSLSRAVSHAHRTAVMVPTCITNTNDLIQTVRGGVSWFERQIMYLKAYYRGLWLAAVPVALVCSALILALPFALVASIAPHWTFVQAGGGAGLVFLVGELLTVLLYPLLGQMPHFGRFLLLQPFMRATHAVSFLRTMFTNVITWSGVRYYVGRQGVVTRVERLTP